jgi:hypothetical protein
LHEKCKSAEKYHVHHALFCVDTCVNSCIKERHLSAKSKCSF